jgi:hypothetical protein
MIESIVFTLLVLFVIGFWSMNEDLKDELSHPNETDEERAERRRRDW